MKSGMFLRVSLRHWEEDEKFSVFYETMERLRCFDEYALFDHTGHTPPPLEVMKQRIPILAKRMNELRKISRRVGINHLCTLGHADEDSINANSNAGRFFTGIDGRSTPGNFCPADEMFRENYIAPVYRMLAETNPDFIWIDDDVRLDNHGFGVHFGCFCDACFERVKKYFNFTGSREEFQLSFDGPATAELRERRLKMLEWNRQEECDLVDFIARTVHNVNPQIILGRMDGPEFWSADRCRQAEVLRGPAGNPVRWRPGGGVYTDMVPDALLSKAHLLGHMVSQLPPFVQEIDSEIENFPSVNLSKSKRFNVMETTAYCAAGCTGTALNILCAQDVSPVSFFEELLLSMKKQKSFNDKVVSGCAGLPPVGIWDGCDHDYFLGNNEKSEHWIGQEKSPDVNFTSGQLHTLGLPVAYCKKNAVCTALSACGAAAASDETLLELLSGGLYLDAAALDILHQRGFSQYLKVRTGKIFERDALEKTEAHELTPLPYLRNMVQSFYGGVATALIPLADDVQILSRLVDFHQNVLADCGSAVFTTPLGGRVCVAGYAPWNAALQAARNMQLHQIFRWLSGDRLPLEVTDWRIRTTVWARRRSDGGCFGCIYNASLDDCEDLKIRLNGSFGSIKLIRDNGEGKIISADDSNSKFSEFKIPEIRFMELICVDTVRK